MNRGVCSQPWTDHQGIQVLLAVDSHGRRIAVTVFPDAGVRYAVRDHLRSVLDLVDLVPSLQVVE